MMDFLKEMFATPEAQIGLYPWAATLAGHGFVGVLMMAVIGATAWVFCQALRRLAIVPRRNPSTYGLLWTIGIYTLWEAGQIFVAGGAIGDGLVDLGAVACGAIIAYGAWRMLIVPIAIGIGLFILLLLDGIRGRNPFN